MSATYDKNQKVTFVYSNLYQIYRKGKEAAKSADLPAEPVVSSSPAAVGRAVLKAENLKAHAAGVSEYSPAEFINKRVPKPEVLKETLAAAKPNQAQSQALQSLKDNLNSLNRLHERLRFMLQELEELVKE